MTPPIVSFADQTVMLLTTLILVSQLMMVTQRSLGANITLFAIQSLFLCGVATVAAIQHGAIHLWFVIALMFGGKVVALPIFLKRLIRKIGVHEELKPMFNSPAAMLLCGGLALLGHWVARPFAAGALVNSALGIAISVVLMGFFLMINRRTAINQVLALLCAENGLYLAAISLTTFGMPLVVELGIFFDLFVAVMVLGILVFRIRETFSTIDVERLNQLKG